MKHGKRKSRNRLELKFTCPECGYPELAECSGGYAWRRFVEAVVCQPTSGDKGRAGEKVQQCEIRYASLADGSPDCDCVEDNYGVNTLRWFACVDCDFVLESEGGSPVEDERELAEWLIKNCPQDAPDSSSLETNGIED
jgi:rubredoxin